MKVFTVTEAEGKLTALLSEAEREPILIRNDDQDVAVILSKAGYEQLRLGNVHAFLEFRKQVAAQAAARGLSEDAILGLLT